MSEEPDAGELRRLAALMQQYGLSELDVREAETSIRLRAAGSAAEVARAGQAGGAGAVVPAGAGTPSRFAGPPPERLHTLIAPLTGTFYRAPSQELPPFVERGSPVETGQPVGLIEAMKLFSEVPADCAGTVHAILVENSRLVQQGEPLMTILLPDA